MSATVYCPPEALLDEYPKADKASTRSYSSQGSTQQPQSMFNNQLPSIFQVVPGGQQTASKADETAHAANYFNNPVPLYYSTQNRRDNDSLGLFHGISTSTSSTAGFLSQAMTPQTSYSGAQSLYTPIPPKTAAKRPTRQSKGSDRCMCKRLENHIPRPRNAFILFRQKHHQSVLRESPKLKTNPEVSREIGNRWKKLSVEEREHWNALADEEKRNHAKKYPDYRYKPRRHKKMSQCAICQVKHMERQSTPSHNFTMFQEYSQLVVPTDSKESKSPMVQQALREHLQMQAQQQGQQQAHLQLMQQQQQQQQQHDVQRYSQYTGYHPQNPYGYSDSLASNIPNNQRSPLQSQQSIQQQYSLQLQQRGQQQQQQQQQPQSSSSGYAAVQQMQAQPQSTGAQSQSVVGGQFYLYADKYHESAATPQYADSGSQKYGSLPTPVSNSSYNGHDSYSVPASLQSY
ncbi:hypothetical protein OXX69_000575 [Metschnikowia pulcherrima]